MASFDPDQDEPEGTDAELSAPTSAEVDEPIEIIFGEVDVDELVAEVTTRIESSYEHSGPLPSQHWLRDVEQLRPGATDLILQEYEEQQRHRRSMEVEVLDFDRRSLQAFTNYQLLQLGIAGLLATLLAAAGLALILLDKPITGFILLIGEIGALVLAFYGRQASDDPAGDGAEQPDEDPA